MKYLNDIIESIAKLGSNSLKVEALIKTLTPTEIIESRNYIFQLFKSDFSRFNNLQKEEQNEFASTGFYYTPLEIANVISEIAMATKPKKIADICNGFSNILHFISGCPVVDAYEPNGDIRKLAQYTFPNFRILGDSLKSTDTDLYDMIVCELRIGRLWTNNGSDSLEESYFKKTLQMLKHDGCGLCVIPNSLLMLEVFSRFRTDFINQIGSLTVIELPAIHPRVINQSLIVFEKGKELKQVRFLKYKNARDTVDAVLNKKSDFIIAVNNLENRLAYPFHNPENRKFETYTNRYTSKKISEFSTVRKGLRVLTSQKSTSGKVRLLRASNISINELVKTNKDAFLKDNFLITQSDYYLKEGDILLSSLWVSETKFAVYHDDKIPSVADANIIVIRSKFSGYLESFLNSTLGKSIFEEQLRLQGTIQIPIKFLLNIKIPMLPLEDLGIFNENRITAVEPDILKQLLSKLEEQAEEIRELRAENKEFIGHTALIPELVLKVNLGLEKLNLIEEKLDLVLKTISDLGKEITTIQKLPRSDEDKIARMYGKLEKKLDQLTQSKVNLEDYIDEIKCWFDYWDFLEPKSRSFLPEAEFLLDKISELPSPDYSPFIIQYSRALENEILRKIFISYHNFLVSEKVDRDVLTEEALSNTKTNIFAKMVSKDNRKYTLGTMNMIMGMLKEGGKTLSVSSLLQDFKEFSNHYFQSHIWEEAYLKKVNRLVMDYRNKAAHPNLISQEQAIEFHELVKECLTEFMKGYKLTGDEKDDTGNQIS
jgi:uncharacterized protein YoxC